MAVEPTLFADVQQRDDTGYIWTLLDEAKEPGRVKPGKIIVAGDPDEPFLAKVIDIIPDDDGLHVVHLEVVGIPGEMIDELRHANLLSA